MSKFVKVRVFHFLLPVLGVALLPASGLGFVFENVTTLRSQNPEQFECLILGDTYFGEVYQDKKEAKLEEFLDLSTDAGYDQAAGNYRKILASSDLRIANFEASITNQLISPLAAMNKEYIHKGHIEMTPAALNRLGINAVTLANNHSMDYGLDGMDQTLRLLRFAGIRTFGVGNNAGSALAPYLFKVPLQGEREFRNLTTGERHRVPVTREFKVAVIGAFEYREPYDEKGYDFYAKKKKPGVAMLHPERLKRLENLVRDLRAFDRDIFIVMLPHWGRDYETVTSNQEFLGKKLRAMGINAVIGHGPHISQPILVNGNQLTAYSIGNFLFNSPGRFNRRYADANGLFVKMIKRFDSDEVVFRFYPTFANNRIVQYRPRLVVFHELMNVFSNLNVAKNTLQSLFGRETLSEGGLRMGEDQEGQPIWSKHESAWYFELKISEKLGKQFGLETSQH